MHIPHALPPPARVIREANAWICKPRYVSLNIQSTTEVIGKDPVVHIRVRWIIETRKDPACALVRLGIALLLRLLWPYPGKAASLNFLEGIIKC